MEEPRMSVTALAVLSAVPGGCGMGGLLLASPVVLREHSGPESLPSWGRVGVTARRSSHIPFLVEGGVGESHLLSAKALKLAVKVWLPCFSPFLERTP